MRCRIPWLVAFVAALGLAIAGMLLYKTRVELDAAAPRAKAYIRHCRMIGIRLDVLLDSLDYDVPVVQHEFLTFERAGWRYIEDSGCVPDTIMKWGRNCVPLSVLLESDMQTAQRQIDATCMRAELTRLVAQVHLFQQF